jgi:hypothetical protein
MERSGGKGVTTIVRVRLQGTCGGRPHYARCRLRAPAWLRRRAPARLRRRAPAWLRRRPPAWLRTSTARRPPRPPAPRGGRRPHGTGPQRRPGALRPGGPGTDAAAVAPPHPVRRRSLPTLPFAQSCDNHPKEITTLLQILRRVNLAKWR